jgi:hypothetical protein
MNLRVHQKAGNFVKAVKLLSSQEGTFFKQYHPYITIALKSGILNFTEISGLYRPVEKFLYLSYPEGV